jgi:hypothetical protein
MPESTEKQKGDANGQRGYDSFGQQMSSDEQINHNYEEL